MKKKIYLMLTFIISLFVFCGNVDAARELVCIYEGGGFSTGKMIVQDTNGNLTLYINSSGEEALDNPTWSNPYEGSSKKFSFNCHNSDNCKNNILTECPKYSSGWNNLKDIVYFSDKVDNSNQMLIPSTCIGDMGESYECSEFSKAYALVPSESGNKLPELDKTTNKTFSSSENENYKKLISERNDWIASCSYQNINGVVSVYFSENDYIIINNRTNIGTSEGKFTASYLNSFFESSKYCPSSIWEYYIDGPIVNETFSATYYFEKPNVITSVVPLPDGNMYLLNQLKYDSMNSEYFVSDDEDDGNEKIDNCEDLIGEGIISVINKIMDLVKIVVPILLIVFGIVDFSKIVFSGKEDEISKSGKRFFMRIVAAILVYFSPILVNLILTIANEVWSFINPDICIK